jgi:hypothetical protein
MKKNPEFNQYKLVEGINGEFNFSPIMTFRPLRKNRTHTIQRNNLILGNFPICQPESKIFHTVTHHGQV